MNVYDAANKRLDLIFDSFENIYVSFSGGKDSGVLLNLCLGCLDRHPGRRLGIFHIDYEAQYTMTTEYVDRTFGIKDDRLEFWRICMPILAQCATSSKTSFWKPWNPDERDIWVREMPKNAVTSDMVRCFKENMWDYDFQNAFIEEYRERHGGGRTCCLVGIRAQESLNRWRTVYAENERRKRWKGIPWTTEIKEGCVNAYPIHDWLVDDIWIANSRYGWDYNKLYDLFYQAGVPIAKMRVASPFNDAATESLKLYKAIEPNMWAKMLGRVDGVNFTAIYGGTTAMGWKGIRLPKGHTWESYMYFLLGTLTPEIRASYLDKLSTSIRFWREKGGVMSKELIEKLKSHGVKVEVGDRSNYKTSKLPVRMEYLDDIDVEEFKEVPTYKRMCICIMKNDHLCKYMGFSQTKDEMSRRKAVMEKYRSIL